MGSSAEVVGSSAEVVGSGVATRYWKSESVTDLPTYGLTWVGARDTCVSNEDKTLKLVLGDFDI